MQFHLRITPTMHRRLSELANKEEVSLNKLIELILAEYLGKKSK